MSYAFSTQSIFSLFKLISHYTNHLSINEKEVIKQMSALKSLKVKVNTENATGTLNVVLRHLTHGNSWLIDEFRIIKSIESKDCIK